MIVRDGRDVVASLCKRYNDFEFSTRRWIEDNQEWLSNLHKDSFHVIRYEDLVKEPYTQLQKICYYLEEEYDENMLFYQKTSIEFLPNVLNVPIEGKNHILLRLYQINQNLYDGSKRYLRDLSNEQIDTLYANTEFMNLMTKFNYC